MGEMGEMGDPGVVGGTPRLGLWLIRVEIDLGEEALDNDDDEEVAGREAGLDPCVLDGVLVSKGVSPSSNRDTGDAPRPSDDDGAASVDCLSWLVDAPDETSLLHTDGITSLRVSENVVVTCGMACPDPRLGGKLACPLVRRDECSEDVPASYRAYPPSILAPPEYAESRATEAGG